MVTSTEQKEVGKTHLKILFFSYDPFARVDDEFITKNKMSTVQSVHYEYDRMNLSAITNCSSLN